MWNDQFAGAVTVDPQGRAAAPAARFADRSATLAVVGLGHVGLPLAQAAAEAGFRTVGLDVDTVKVARLNAGESPLPHLPAGPLRRHLATGRLRATTDPE